MLYFMPVFQGHCVAPLKAEVHCTWREGMTPVRQGSGFSQTVDFIDVTLEN
jgi:hypothetical protein